MATLSPHFVCPITQQLMINPMIDPEGNSYERQAIEEWIKQKGTSPVTNASLTLDQLLPNTELATKIQQYLLVKSQSELHVTGNYSDSFVHLSIQPSASENRSPCDLCCVLDVSGSMDTRAEIQNDKNEKYGLSQLDLVKHSMKTIIHSLQPQDRLSIVTFSCKAKTLLSLKQMDEQGRADALAIVEKLRTEGSTNLWDGLQTGIEVLSKEQRPVGSNVALFLLTDGCPTTEPAGGHIKALTDLKQKINFNCNIHTFGFGYSLDSKLLENIAVEGNSGSYGFIPDGSFVGTIFVNALTNLLSTVATNVLLTFPKQIFSDSPYTRWYTTSSNDDDVTIQLGSIIFGQSKDLLIPITSGTSSNDYRFTLRYDTIQGKNSSQTFNLTEVPNTNNSDEMIRQQFRLEFVDQVRTALNRKNSPSDHSKSNLSDHPAEQNSIETLATKMQTYIGTDEFIKDLHADLTGQVQEALGKSDWFTKWGRHFLPSLTRAHLFQYCNNFKDPGVQHYGNGALFTSIRDEMDSIFCGLPAPVGTKIETYADSGVKYTTPTNMNVFYHSGGGCFYGGCTVRLIDGTLKLVKDVKPGDQMAPHGGVVNYVVKTKCHDKQAKMVILDSGLIITAWHPIRFHQQWIMPCSLVQKPNEIVCDYVYNFALDHGHTMFVNDTECVTLGHGFKDDIVRHKYYGSNQVIEDLKRIDLEQNKSGIVEISEQVLIRDKKTTVVTGVQRRTTLVQ